MSFIEKHYSMLIRNYSCIFILLIILIPAHVTAQDAEFTPTVKAIDHIVAIVNEDVITRKELNEAIKTAVDRFQLQGIQLPDQQTMENQVLESIVAKRIQLQHAKEVGLSVSESEIDETVHRIACLLYTSRCV